jgi:hypothetical protein
MDRRQTVFVTVDTGASVRISGPDITTELPKRDLTVPYILQILKEALVMLNGV